MRGIHYNDGKRKVFTNGGYLGAIIAVVALAIALVFLLLVYLPLTNPEQEQTEQAVNIVSIEYADKEIGLGSDIGKIGLTVTYDDGSTEVVSMSNMISEGLDVTKSGTQNVSLSYGGFEQTITVKVKDVNCRLTYLASIGGSIQGENNQLITSGQDGDTVIAIPETGYVFSEWSDGYPYATRKDLAVNESKEIMANFQKAVFRVTFFAYDGTVAGSCDVVYGEKATGIPQMTDPAMSVYGMTFQGWSVSEEDYTHVIRNMSIYPQYVKTATDVEVEVSSDQYGNVMGETNANECGYYAYDEKATVIASPYNSREFNKWQIWGYKTKNDEECQWISLDKIGEIGAAEITVYIGDNREPCLFSSNASGNEGTKFALTFIPDKYMDDIKIRACFVYSKSTVTFINYQNSVKNNQECVVSDITYGTTVGKALQEKAKTEEGAKLVLDKTFVLLPSDVVGMTFVGWYDKADPEQAIINNEKIFEEPTSLIAKWDKIEYTIVFDYSTSDVTEEYSIQVLFQNTIGSGGGLPTVKPTLTKNVFVGWEDELTKELVDDKTQIIAKEQYIGNAYFDKYEIHMVPRWKSVEHTLNVQSTGSGTVALEITSDLGYTSTTTVSGSYTLYEIYTYKIYFYADEGNCVSAYTWKHGDVTDVYGDAEIASGSIAPVVIETVDNTFHVTFAPIRYTVTVQNGSSLYSGIVVDKAKEDMYGDQTIVFSYNHNATLELLIRSAESAYEIKSIALTGTVKGVTYLGEYYGGLLEGKGLREYSVLLERCTSDLTIEITYSDISYTVSINQPAKGSVKTTTLNGEKADMEQADGEKECSPGSRLFYAIEADEGQYVSNVRINGVRYNVFDTTDSVVFYDWEINGVSYGVSLQYIEGAYYYTYGTATYKGTEYLYGQETDSKEETVFAVVNGDYESFSSAAQNAAPSRSFVTEVLTFLKKELGVKEKGIGDNSVVKDNRITSVKVMILPQKDMNLHIVTEEIFYTVSVAEDDGMQACSIAVDGSASQTTSVKVHRGQNIKLMVSPVNGSKCVGYYKNDVYESISSVGNTFMKEMNAVAEDIVVRFVFRKDSFTVTFRASESNAVSVTGGETHTLAKSYDFTVVYGENVQYSVQTVAGKVISALRVDGEDKPVTYAMTKYSLLLPSVKKNVEVYIETENAPANDVPSGYSYAIGTPDKYYASVAYGTTDDVITVLAENGYEIDKITLTGMVGGEKTTVTVLPESVSLANGITAAVGTNGTDRKRMTVVTVPTDVFAGEVEVYAKVSVLKYNITCSDNGNGSVLYNGVKSTTVPYGSTIDVTVSADANYYLDAFYINGTLIAFTDENWQSGKLNYDSFVREYTAGVYAYTVCGDVEVEAVFYRYTYHVSVDTGSVNGSTEISLVDKSLQGMTGLNLVDGANGIAVPYGASIYVLMTADKGYHIGQVYINGELSSYRSQDLGTINNNTIDIFEYGGTGAGITEDLTIKVIYEINRYSFTYEIVNDSANFAGLAGAGTIACQYPKNGADKYGSEKDGIAHGDNFFINVSPAVSGGYYLYSMSITYKGYGKDASSVITRTYDDGTGILSSTGGQVYFNRFWFYDSEETPTGVTSDIEKITLTFKRQMYALSLEQTGKGGTTEITFSNASAASSDSFIVLFGREKGTDNALTTFYYHPLEKVVYRKVGSVYEPTTIVFAAVDTDVTAEKKEVLFVDGATQYEIFIEYGLRCMVTTTPNNGYDRDSFLVNGENKAAYISNDSYEFTFYRTTVVSVEFIIKYYDVRIEAVVYNKGVKVSTTGGKADEYVNITMIVEDDKGKSEYRTTGTKSLIIQKSLAYNTKVTFELESYFYEKGVYLYNMTKTVKKNDSSATMQLAYGSQPNNYTGDVEGTVQYGPVDVSESFTMGAYFQVRQYSVETAIVYSDDVVGETVNAFYNEKTNAEKWTVYWGDETAASIVLADGYQVARVEVVEGDDSVYMTADEPNVEQDYFFTDGRVSASSVKLDLIFRIYLERKSYYLMYSLNNESYIKNIQTSFNEYNNKFEKQTVQSSTSYSPWTVDVHAYDEVSITLEPNVGYEIVATQIDIHYVTQDVNTGDWKKTGISKTFVLSETGVQDVKYLTFHPVNRDAALQVESDMLLEISVTIKQYKIVTDISRTDADGDTSETKNNTAVKMSILDKANGNYLTIRNEMQTPYTFKSNTVASEITTQVAQHFGVVQYEFTTPDGYRLNNFTVNGYTLDGLQENKLLQTYTVSKSMLAKIDGTASATYNYSVVFLVTASLLSDVGYDEINVSIDLAPIVYTVAIVLNDSQKSFVTKNGRNGATDNKQITVYSAKEVTHFSSLIIEPLLEEGYQISREGGAVKTYASIGTETKDVGLPTHFANINEAMTARTQLNFNTSNLLNCDVGLGQTTVYFYYYTNIIHYQIALSSNVYYAESGSLVGPVSLASYNDQKTTAEKAGFVKSSVSNEEDKTVGLLDTNSGHFDESFPYFTKVKLTFSANQLHATKIFGVFAVYEFLNGEWTEIQDGNRGLSYTYNAYVDEYTLSFSVDSLGDRTFKIDYKEKTRIHVIVTNPYKYYNGENLYYTDINVYESDVQNKVGELLSTTNVLADNEVITEYVYTVNIGNYLRVKFIDRYADGNAKSNVEFYIGKKFSETLNTQDVDNDLKDVVKYMVGDTVNNGSDNTFSTGKFSSNYTQNSLKGYQKNLNYDTTALGYQVSGDEYIYVYDKSNYSYVQAEKTTEDATNSLCDINGKKRTSEGGTVLFNTNKEETPELDYYAANTAACNILTITCQAKENYAFYRLAFRQTDTAASKKAGSLVYDQGATTGWRYLTYAQAGNTATLQDFNDKNNNAYVVVDFSERIDNSGKKQYVFVIWLNGPIDVEAEFYRVYDVSYAVWRTDIRSGFGTVDSAISTITATDNGDTLFGTPFASATETGKATLSYGAEFTLEVLSDAILSNYVFVGWYVNDINLISTLNKGVPEKNRYKQRISLQAQELSGLVSDGTEATDVVIYARFEPVIDVQVLNEKFYSFPDHFNSWAMGTAYVSYYGYNDGIIDAESTTVTIAEEDPEGRKIAQVLNAVEQSGASKYGKEWSDLYVDANYGKGTSGSLSENYRIFSAWEEFSVLHENITNSDYITNSWVTTKLELLMDNMDNDVRFAGWQYYNWKTQEWQDIGYSYKDASFGSEYVIDFTKESYAFSLDYLYSYYTADQVQKANMPYAISVTNEFNLCQSEADVAGKRPLLIRANTYKEVTIKLLQYAYSDTYEKGLEGIDRSELSEDIVHPIISAYTLQNEEDGRNITDTSGVSGTYEYGTELEIKYDSNENEEIYNDDRSIRYRFTGWHVMIDGTMYCLEGSTSGNFVFRYRLLCAPMMSNTDMKLNAYYVTQYKQIIHSYGVSSSGERTFESCYSSLSGEASPDFYITATATATPISIPVATMSNNLVNFKPTTADANTFALTSTSKNEYMKVYSAPENGDICLPLLSDGAEYVSDKGRTMECYLDAGLTFRIVVCKEEDKTSTADIKNGRDTNGYNHEFDTLYQVIENDVITQDFSSYYNTGDATYSVNGSGVSSLYLTNRAFAVWNTITVVDAYVNGTWGSIYSQFTKYDAASSSFRNVTTAALTEIDVTDQAKAEENWTYACRQYFYYDNAQNRVVATEDDNPNKAEYRNRSYYTVEGVFNRAESYKSYVSNKNFTVDIQYVTTAVLVFYNMIYESGISVVEEHLIRDLTGGKKTLLTVWDDDGVRYGDWVADGEKIKALMSGGSQANGEVVIRVTLQRMDNSGGYAKQVKYALNGMKEGSGIETDRAIYDGSGRTLFNPMTEGYGRWFEYNMNEYFGVLSNSPIRNTLVFGKGADGTNTTVNTQKVGIHATVSYAYNTAHCGNGTAENPYYVYIPLTDSYAYTTDNTQLRFLDTFWKNNEYSCQDSDNKQTYFKIYMQSGQINLQGQNLSSGSVVNDPKGNTAYWTPLFMDTEGDSTDGNETIIRGFDGVLLGNGAVFEGLAMYGNFSGQYYGIFAKVCGGTVRDVTLRNAFVDLTGNPETEYVGGLVAYAKDITLINITVQLYTTLAYGNHHLYGTSGITGAAVYMQSDSFGFVGSVVGCGQNVIADTIVLDYRNGDYLVDITTESGYSGALFGAVEGGNMQNIYVRNGSNGWIAIDGSDSSSKAAGGLFGYLGGAFTTQSSVPTTQNPLLVKNVQITSDTYSRGLSLIIGNEYTLSTGGLVGIVGYGCTLEDVRIHHANTDNFYVNKATYTEARRGTVLQAKTTSILDSSDKEGKRMASSMSYGFVGGIAGSNYGTISGSSSGLSGGNYTQTGLIHIYAGTAGGAVGANFGTVQNIYLYTADTNAFRALVWQPTDTTQSLNYGGVVGYNYAGTNADKDDRSAVSFAVVGGEAKNVKFNVNGLVTDCYVRGTASGSSEENSLGTSAFSSSVLYVFERTGMYDDTYKSGSTFYTRTSWTDKGATGQTATPISSLQISKNRNYLRLGGIVGFSSGRIYNSGIRAAKVSTYCNRYAYRDSPSNGAIGGYAWAIQAGLICGYFNPNDNDIEGCSSIMDLFGTGLMDISSLSDINTNRIQSCYASNSYLIINGSLWMDDMWECNNSMGGGSYYDYSLPVGIAASAIVGGTGPNADSDFAVSNCAATGNTLSAVFQAYGSDFATTNEKSKDSGWYIRQETTESKSSSLWGISKAKYVHKAYIYCKRVYCMVELNFAAIASGFTTERTGVSRDSNIASACYYADNAQVCTAQPDFSNIQSLTYKSMESGETKDTSNPYNNLTFGSSATQRYITYSGEVQGPSGNGALKGYMQSTVMQNSTPIESLSGMSQKTFISTVDSRVDIVSYGFMRTSSGVRVLRTDPDTGLYLAYGKPGGDAIYKRSDGTWEKLGRQNLTSAFAQGNMVYID